MMKSYQENTVLQKKWLSFTDLQIYEYKNIKGDICSEMYISD